MDVKYTTDGPVGKTCTDCANYKPKPGKPGLGDCFGHEVISKGSCNYFQKK
jgi:hypothetical protein